MSDFKSTEQSNEAILRLDLDGETLKAIRKALDEDIGAGDVTTNSIVALEAIAVARIIAKQNGFVSGLAIAQAVFLMLDNDIRFSSNLLDGAEVTSEQLLIELKGAARAILTGERTSLNLFGWESG